MKQPGDPVAVESPGFVFDSLLYHHINVFAYTPEILHDRIVWNPDHQQSPIFKLRCSDLVCQHTFRFVMLGAIQFDHELRLSTIEICDIPVNYLLAKESYRIITKEVIPHMSFFFRHVSSQRTGISCKLRIMLIVHRLPPKPPLSKGGGPRSGGGIQRHKVRIRLRFRRIRTICCESPAHKLLLAIYELPPLTRGPLSDYFNSHSLICMAFS